MKTISALIFGGGLAFTIGSFIRYYIFFPDYDKVLAYCLIGLLYIGFAFLYERQTKHSATLNGVEEYLADRK